MTYEFEIIRKPITRTGDLLVASLCDDSAAVYSGSIGTANDAGLRVVLNHLAMRSHAKYNGDKITSTQTWCYWVRWAGKKPRGQKFRALSRYSWL